MPGRVVTGEGTRLNHYSIRIELDNLGQLRLEGKVRGGM